MSIAPSGLRRRQDTYALLRQEPAPWAELDVRDLEEAGQHALRDGATRGMRARYQLSEDDDCCVNNPDTALRELRFYGVVGIQTSEVRSSRLGSGLDGIYTRWTEVPIDPAAAPLVDRWVRDEIALVTGQPVPAETSYTIIAAGATN